MAQISFFRTLRGGRVLLRHQMLTAMHEVFGRPTFRPTPPPALGLGVAWAFLGQERFSSIRNTVTNQDLTDDDLPGIGRMVRETNQLRETMTIAGPADDEVQTLRAHGYRPETTEESSASRLAWEELFVGMLRDDPVAAAELRVRVTARELCHEHLDLFNECLTEYRAWTSTGSPASISAVPALAAPR